VTRLAATYQVDRQPETIFIRWAHPYDRCPACGYDLDAHRRAGARAIRNRVERLETAIRGNNGVPLERLLAILDAGRL